MVERRVDTGIETTSSSTWSPRLVSTVPSAPMTAVSRASLTGPPQRCEAACNRDTLACAMVCRRRGPVGWLREQRELRVGHCNLGRDTWPGSLSRAAQASLASSWREGAGAGNGAISA